MADEKPWTADDVNRVLSILTWITAVDIDRSKHVPEGERSDVNKWLKRAFSEFEELKAGLAQREDPNVRVYRSVGRLMLAFFAFGQAQQFAPNAIASRMEQTRAGKGKGNVVDDDVEDRVRAVDAACILAGRKPAKTKKCVDRIRGFLPEKHRQATFSLLYDALGILKERILQKR
jgi:hypothetical protein